MSLHYKLFKGDILVNTSVEPVSFVLSTKAIDEEFMCAMTDMAVKTNSMIRMSIVFFFSGRWERKELGIASYPLKQVQQAFSALVFR